MGWTPNRPRQQMADPFLQDLVGVKADRVLEPPGFEIGVDIGIGEGRISAKGAAYRVAPVAGHDGIKHIFPAIGGMHIARTERATLQITELVEYKQLMIAAAAEMAVPDAVLLFLSLIHI